MSASSNNRQLAINVLAGSGGTIVKIILQLIMLPLMARLLGPSEFGIYGLALPAVAFFSIIADGGLGVSLARERRQATIIWSTAFWFTLCLGFVLTAMVACWGVILAYLSREAQVKNVMALLSIGILFLSVSIIPSARLYQQGRLVIFTVADVSSTLIGSAIGIWLAFNGAGAMSLAAQYVVGYFVRAVFFNLAAFVRPEPIFDFSSIKEHVAIGTSLLSGRLADFAGRLSENVIYGRTFGPAALGAFSFANQIPRFLTDAVSNPTWSALYAYSLREDGPSLREIHLKIVHALALILIPVAFVVSAIAPEIIMLVLGPKWIDASVLLRVLFPFYVLNVIFDKTGPILLAKGFGWTLFFMMAFLSLGRVVAVLFGSVFGSSMVVICIGVVHLIYSALMIIVPTKMGLIRALPVLRCFYAPIAAGAMTGFSAYYIQLYSAWYFPGSPAQTTIFSISASGLIYMTAIVAIDGKRVYKECLDLIRLVRGTE